MKRSIAAFLALALSFSLAACNKSSNDSNKSNPPPGNTTTDAESKKRGERGLQRFSKVFVVILENTAANKALKQPFLKSLTEKGAYLESFYGVARPSQPNYIGLTSGSTHGVKSNKNVDLDVSHIGDLLEAKGYTWKSYAEDYPTDSGCFLEEKSENGKYTRKHSPFASYVNVQKSTTRCANIVNAGQLDKDVADNKLANFSLYVPNMDNDGHDTDVKYASAWLEKKFGPLLENPDFMKDMLFVVTFDEGGKFLFIPLSNRIYTVMIGDSIIPGHVEKAKYDLYSLLRTIEDNFGLGTLRREDERATPIQGVWKK